MKRPDRLPIASWFFLVVLLAAMATGGVVHGETPDKMIQQAKNQLRAAESNMHNGNREEAAKGVQEVAEILFRVREMDPDNSKLVTVIWKAEGLRDTLQKRMGTTITLRTDPGAGTPSTAEGSLPDDAATLARQAGDLLRKSESDMHNGKNTEARAKLDQAEPLVAKLREVDPQHSKLMVLESALVSQSKTIDERLEAANPPVSPPAMAAATAAVPKTTPKAPATAAAPATGAAQAPKGKLPYHTRNVVDRIEKDFQGMERYFTDMANGTQSFDDATMFGRIATRIESIEQTLPGLRDQAATDGVSDDPRVTGVEPRLAKARLDLEALRADSATRGAAATAAKGGVDADVEALQATFDRLYDGYFSKCTGTAIYYNDLAAPREILALVEKFENEELARTQAQFDQYSGKYGSTRNEVEASTGSMMGWYPYEGIRDGIANVARTREAMAEDLVRRAEESIQGLPSLHDIYRMTGHDNARGFLVLAERFSPGNAAVQSLKGTIDSRLDADLQAYVKKIEDTTWPGSTGSGDAKAALKFFQEDVGWGRRDQNPRAEDKDPRRPLGVAVTGDWSVQERNLVGQPTMYGLPVLVAVQLDREKGMGLARVYSVTMRTAESPNPQMKPPFTSITVGSSYFIKASKVK